jgi:hypothetical protein
VLRRLSSPLQVVVAGRIKSGKSTLVNALIGRRVAQTAVGECTRLVTRFHYGTVDRVEVVFRDGRNRVLPFTAEGMIPAELGVNIADVSHLEVYLTSAVLRNMTVIDTPGLGSLDTESSARTEQLLGAESTTYGSTADESTTDELDETSRSAVSGAEAVLYVFTQDVRADDREALAVFAAATAGREAGPVNAIALLNKADTVIPETVSDNSASDNSAGDGVASANIASVGAQGNSPTGDRVVDDPVWNAANILAAKQAETLKPRVAEVLPVIGLLAETTESGGFTSAHAKTLQDLARIPDESWEIMMASADLFTSWESDVPSGLRADLLEKLDLFGIRRAVEAVKRQPEITAGALRRYLVDLSGLEAVRANLEAVFAARADGIKAAAALASITAVSRAYGDRAEQQRVHDAIEVLLARPEAHQLRLLEALTSVTSGAVEMPPDLTEEVLRVGSSVDPTVQLGMTGGSRAALAAFALERAGWWRSFASFGATPAQSRIAHVVHRAYFLIWQRIQAIR